MKIFFNTLSNQKLVSNVLYKVLILGDNNSGKTSILQNLLERNNIFNNILFIRNIGIESYTCYKKNISFIYFDTTLINPSHNNIINSYIKMADIILLVFDMTNIKNFYYLNIWLDLLKDKDNIIIVGNKCDGIIKINFMKVYEIMHKYMIPTFNYIELSAIYNINMDLLENKIIKMATQINEKKNSKINILLDYLKSCFCCFNKKNINYKNIYN